MSRPFLGWRPSNRLFIGKEHEIGANSPPSIRYKTRWEYFLLKQKCNHLSPSSWQDRISIFLCKHTGNYKYVFLKLSIQSIRNPIPYILQSNTVNDSCTRELNFHKSHIPKASFSLRVLWIISEHFGLLHATLLSLNILLHLLLFL